MKIRLTTHQFLFLFQIFYLRSWSMMSSTIKTYIMLEFFESLNDTKDFLLWNSEQGTGEWLLLRKLFGTFFTSKWLFSWISVRWVLRLPDSENDLEHYLQGRGMRGFFTNGFSSKMASPQKMASPRKWLLLGNNFSPGNSKYITF